MGSTRPIIITALVLALTACAPATHPPGDVTEARLLSEKSDSGNWLTSSAGWRGTYYSGLRRIDTGNADRLGFAWQYDLRQTRGQEATPVVVDGVLYVSTNWGHVAALDGETGRQLWTYDPEVDGQWGRYACCDVVNRGLTVANGVVYVGSTDNYLHAIDARTGKRLWKVDTLDPEARARHTPYTTSGTPQVAGDVVVIGNGGEEQRGALFADGERRGVSGALDAGGDGVHARAVGGGARPRAHAAPGRAGRRPCAAARPVRPAG